MKSPKRKNSSCAISFVNRKVKAKVKTSTMLQLHLIILLVNVLPPHPLCGSALLLTAGEWFLQSAGIRDEQTRPSLRGLCAWLPALCAVCFSGHKHYALGLLAHAKAFQRSDIPGGNYHCRAPVQQLTEGTVTKQSSEQPAQLEISANKSLFHTAPTVYVWFILWWFMYVQGYGAGHSFPNWDSQMKTITLFLTL